MKICIIGGGAGGASVAARTRRLDEFAEIILFEKSDTISQATCGIPYHIGNVITERSRLVVVEQEQFKKLLNVDVRTNTEVMAIDRKLKRITVKEIETGHLYQEHYDKLVLSTGSKTAAPKIDGVDRPHVFSLHNLSDLDALKTFIKKQDCRNAAVIGAGFIGLEVADNLHALGLNTSIVEASDQVMQGLDYEMAALVQQHIYAKQINLILNDSVDKIDDDSLTLASGHRLKAELVIISVGVKPAIKLAEICDLEIGSLGGITVNRGMQTSGQDIYALGDSVEVDDGYDGEKMLVQLAGPTHKQASVVASNLTGGNATYRPVIATSIAKIFDLTVASTGYSEKKLKKKGIAYKKSYTDVPAHASYYPGAFPIMIKLLFAVDTGHILGAQAIGSKGVDKRLDLIASAMQFGGTVQDLAEMELAYAPPYSSAKDPVNIAGMVANNIIEQNHEVVYWDEVESLLHEDVLFLDVSTKEEHAINAIADSINIPLEELRERLSEIPRDKKITIYCQQGKKSYFASRILRQNGYSSIHNLSGGAKLYHGVMQQRNMLQISGKQQSDFKDMHHDTKDAANTQPTDNRNNTEVRLNIDATGLSCPGPILRLSKGIKSINGGDFLLIKASDSSFYRDVDSWCRKTGNLLHERQMENAMVTALIQKYPAKNNPAT